MAGKIYTIGYSQQGDEALALLNTMLSERVPDEQKPAPVVLRRHPELLYTHMLIDIRTSPRAPVDSRFDGRVLAKRFVRQYKHVPEFGNKNFRTKDRHKGIEINHIEAGFSSIKLNLLMHHLIFLCACPDYHTCHRRVVVEYLSKQFSSLVVEHLLVPPQPVTFTQESLF